MIGDAAGSKALSRALRSKPQRNTHHPVFLSKHEVSIDINRVSTPLEIWQASVESYAALTQLLLDVVFLVVDPSQDNCIESTQSKPVRLLDPPRCPFASRDMLLSLCLLTKPFP